MEEERESKESWPLFVYGTLRKGFSNHHLLVGAMCLGPARTKEKYALFEDGIPYAATGNPVSQIAGEVYKVNAMTLRRIDQLEGHPDWYRRQPVEVTLMSGATLTAWLYFCDHPRGRLVESGDFAEVTKGRIV